VETLDDIQSKLSSFVVPGQACCQGPLQGLPQIAPLQHLPLEQLNGHQNIIHAISSW